MLPCSNIKYWFKHDNFFQLTHSTSFHAYVPQNIEIVYAYRIECCERKQ